MIKTSFPNFLPGDGETAATEQIMWGNKSNLSKEYYKSKDCFRWHHVEILFREVNSSEKIFGYNSMKVQFYYHINEHAKFLHIIYG